LSNFTSSGGFGTERIKGIKYFGPYEGEDPVGIVYVEGIDEREDTVGVDMRLLDMFDETESRRTLCIARAKEGVGEDAAA